MSFYVIFSCYGQNGPKMGGNLTFGPSLDRGPLAFPMDSYHNETANGYIFSDNDQLEESIRRKEDIVNGLSGLWVDRVSRKLFPISFTIFNIFYWATCCSVPKEDLPDDCVVQPI